MTGTFTKPVQDLGRAMSRGPKPSDWGKTDTEQLRSRMFDELDLAMGSAGIFLGGFLLVFGLGLATGSLWHSPKIGAAIGGAIGAAGIAGVVVHYTRSRILSRRVHRLMRGQPLEDPLSETFGSISSDRDFVLQVAIGVVAALLTLTG